VALGKAENQFLKMGEGVKLAKINKGREGTSRRGWEASRRSKSTKD